MKKLVISHDTFIGKRRYTKTLPLYKRIGEYYLISRFSDLENIVGTNIQIKYKNKLHEGNVIEDERLMPGVDLLENQQVAFDFLEHNVYSKENISRGFASCIFVMDTGLGKTYIGGAFIEFCKKKTLIIVQKTSPIPEWITMLGEYFPYLEVGEYHSQSPKSDGDVVIMTIDSALNDEFTWKRKTKMHSHEYFKLFGAVIFDEVHNYSTLKRQEIFWKTNFQYVLGLTATPDERADGMDSIAEGHLGKVIRAIKIPGFNVEEISWIGKVSAIRYSGPPEYTKKHMNREGWINTQKTCEQFIIDPYRNKLIVQEVKKLYDKGKHIFIFSERREYLQTLKIKLKENGLLSLSDISDNPIHTLMGGSSNDEKIKAREEARIILITYGYGIESISISKMDAILFATPRRNKMRQTLGRILRRSGDPKIHRRIIDIIDENTSLKSQFVTRKKVYKEKGFSINESHVSFENISL